MHIVDTIRACLHHFGSHAVHVTASRPLLSMGRPASSKPSKAPLALHQLSGEIFSVADLEGEYWYNCCPKWPSEGTGGIRGTIKEWREVAAAALASTSKAYEKRVGSGRNTTARALTKEKTIGDKIAAITLLVQESPLHRLDEIHMLLDFTKKKNRRESAPAVEAMKDLFLTNLLPDNRRLIRFEDREFGCEKQAISKRHVAYALFEDELKTVYHEFLKVLEDSGKDVLAHFKQKAVKQISELLIAKPEHEKELLSMLVNKLGDPDRKVSSTASFNLSQLIDKHHPQMRLIVIREVEQLLTRPNVTMRTQYFAVSFLCQIRLSNTDVELARRLLRLYMGIFTTYLAKEKDVPKQDKTKIAKIRKKQKRKRLRDLQKAPSTPKPEISVALKETRLMGALLMGANRAYPFSNPDQDDFSYEEHHAALFSVAHAQALGPATQALAFLFQVSQSHSTLGDRFYRALYSRIHDAADAGEPKQAQFLNLLYRALDADTNPRRAKAFVKRLIQAASNGSSAFAGACVIVLFEFYKHHRGLLASFISLPEHDDAEETFVDVDKPQVTNIVAPAGEPDAETTNPEEKPRHPSATEPEADVSVKMSSAGVKSKLSALYDIQKRDPQHAGAEFTSLWELVALCSHFHPSVSVFSKTLCGNLETAQYSGDPLKDFSLISFLDRFVYKKPKNRLAKSLYGKRSAHYRTDPVANSEAFQEHAKQGNIGEDDKFFVRFFDTNPTRVLKEVTEAGYMNTATDGMNQGDDSEEEAFEEAMKAEMRRLGADSGFVSSGIRNHLADVDDEDPDELEAFEKAFANDLSRPAEEGVVEGAGLDEGGNPDLEDDSVVPLQAFENSDEGSDGDGEDNFFGASRDGEGEQPQKRRKKGQISSSLKQSAFAAAEDYDEEINQDLLQSELNGRHSPVELKIQPKETVRSSRKSKRKRRR